MPSPRTARPAPRALTGAPTVVLAAALALPLGAALPTASAAPAEALPAPASPAAPAAPAAARAADGPVTVRFLQYNIRFGQFGPKNVAADIRRSGATVVMLNEVDDRRARGGVLQAKVIAEELGMNWVYQPNGTVRPGLRGNAILSTYPITFFRKFALPQPDGTEARGLLKARVKIDGLGVDVWSTHLNPGAGRLRQARVVRRTIGDPTCATMLGGDMNASPDRQEHAVLTTHLEDLWARVGTGRGETTKRRTARIDYLFLGRGTGLSSHVTPLRHSDHRGVVGTARFGPRASC